METAADKRPIAVLLDTQMIPPQKEVLLDEWLLALDFGGTKHTAGLLKRGDRTWSGHRRAFAAPGANAQTDLQVMLGLVTELLGGRQPAAIGVSFGGPADFQTGIVRLSHHVPGWEGLPLGPFLLEKLGAPASVDNDANVAAQGEHRFGAGQGRDSLLYLTVSTGVGGGWILNGRPWRGADGMAGEIGHTVVDPNGPQCLCGKRGCLERLVSGPYMAADVRRELHDQPERGGILRKMAAGDLEAVTGKMLSQAAAQGDDLAWEYLSRGAWALGIAIGNAANLINLQRFVLGGGVTKSGERFWEIIRRVSRQTALPEVQFEVIPAALGDDAPLWGAAALAEDLLVGLSHERRDQ